MYVKKNVKKYVCPSRSVSRVQPMVLDRGGGKRTKPTPVNIEVKNVTNYDDYSGADVRGSDIGLDRFRLENDQKKVNSELRLKPI